MRSTPLLLAMISVATAASEVIAQDVSPAPKNKAWVGIIVAILLAIVVLLVSIKGSKRTHQD